MGALGSIRGVYTFHIPPLRSWCFLDRGAFRPGVLDGIAGDGSTKKCRPEGRQEDDKREEPSSINRLCRLILYLGFVGRQGGARERAFCLDSGAAG